MTLHKQSIAFLEAIRAADRPAWYDMQLTQARDLFSDSQDLFGQAPACEHVEEVSFDGLVTSRLYSSHDFAQGVSQSGTDECILIYLHGGGWVLGDLDTHDAVCRRLHVACRCPVLSVDYRRAPEHCFPSARDDCYRVLQGVIGGKLVSRSFEPHQVIVAGDSAGGHLAAGVAVEARRAGYKLAGQVLIYPAIAPRFDSESYLVCADGFGLTRQTMIWFWEQYLGVELRRMDRSSAAATLTKFPGVDLLSVDLPEDLPPALIVTAEYDVLRDEGHQYTTRLREVGNQVRQRTFSGMLHGFFHFAAMFDDHQAVIEEIASFVSESCHS